jgi:chromosome segregation ATPase
MDISELENEIKKLEARKGELTSELDRASAEVGKAESDRAAAILKGEQFDNVKRIESLRQSVTDSRAAIRLADENLLPLRQELARLTAMEQAKQEQADFVARVSSVTAEIQKGLNDTESALAHFAGTKAIVLSLVAIPAYREIVQPLSNLLHYFLGQEETMTHIKLQGARQLLEAVKKNMGTFGAPTE